MCDPLITYGLILYSPETWALKSLPLMALVPGWLLCVSVHTCLGVIVISDPTEHCDGKSMKHQLLLWGFQVDGIAWSCLITTVHSKALSPQSTRARAAIPKIKHCSAKGILCWRLQLLSLSWSINAGLLFAWSSCCYGELQTGLCCHSWSCTPCPFFKGNRRNAEGSADPCWKSF